MLCEHVRPSFARAARSQPETLALVRRILGGELRGALAEPPERDHDRHRAPRARRPRAPPRAPPAQRRAALTRRLRRSGRRTRSEREKGPRLRSSVHMAKADLMDRVVNLAKRRGLVFPSSEIYGGFRSTWDYGPLGVLLKRNVKDAWWRSMVQLRDDVVGLDAAILMAPKVWEASGHLATFTDPLVDCRNCKERFRADQLPESGACPNCGAKDIVHRGAAVQPDVQDVRRPGGGRRRGRVPAPGDRAGHLRQLRERADDDAQEAAVRHRADRQVVPQRDHARATSSSARASSSRWRWSTSCRPTTARSGTSTGARSGSAGTPTSASPRSSCACARTTPTSSRTTRPARPTSSSCTRGAGASSRASPTAPTSTSRSTAKFSGQDLSYYDQENDRRYVPHVIEPAAGADRATLAFLLAAYDEEEVAQRQGRHREAHGAAPPPAPRADQGRGAAAVEERAAGAGGRRGRRRCCGRTS